MANRNEKFLVIFSVVTLVGASAIFLYMSGHPPTFIVRVKTVGGGTVRIDSMDTMSIVVYPRTNITLTAIPYDGYIFSTWTGDYNELNRTITITIDKDMYLTAVFVRKK
jgi:hypothetical protein